MPILRFVSLFLALLMLGATSLYAETRYVTDRILLGVHADPSEESPLLDSVPSGTAVEILESNENFSRVRLPNGNIGWVSRGYLMKEPPATATVDQLQARQEKITAQLKALQEKLAKKERELQVRGDELSNARTTIKELKKKGTVTVAPKVDANMAEELASAHREITDLRQQLAQLKADAAAKPEPVAGQAGVENRVAQLEQENTMLKSRIELASASLAGEGIPDAVEMALMKPAIPGWYWGALVLVLILGIAAGLLFMDHLYRKRHGGFRI